MMIDKRNLTIPVLYLPTVIPTLQNMNGNLDVKSKLKFRIRHFSIKETLGFPQMQMELDTVMPKERNENAAVFD
jgi:hypothetical protein